MNKIIKLTPSIYEVDRFSTMLLHKIYKENPDMAIKELSSMIGSNTGNLVFHYGLHKLLGGISTTAFFADELNEKCNGVLFAAANQVNPHSDLGFLADEVEKLKVPIAVLGLGCQIDDVEQSNVVLKKGTIRFLNALANKTSNLGVRGERTAEILNSLGIRNVEIVGCPSMTINDNLNIGNTIKEKFDKTFGKVLVSQSHGDYDRFPNKKELYDLEKKMISWIGNGSYVLQSPSHMIKHFFGSENLSDQEKDYFLDIFSQKEKDYEFINKFRIFGNVPDWMWHIKNHDITIGYRLHSALLSLQSEVPTVLIEIDGRVKELAKTCMIPSLSIEKANQANSLEELVGMTNFNPTQFDQNRKELINIQKKLIKDNLDV